MADTEATQTPMTVSEAARELGRAEATIRAWVDRGELDAVRVGGNKSRFITPASIARKKREGQRNGAR